MIHKFALHKTIHRAASVMLASATLAALAAMIGTPASAQVSQADYATTVAAVTDRIIVGAAGAGFGDRPAAFFDLNGVDGTPAQGDAVIDGARRLYEIYRALGGPRLDRHGYYERKDGRIYIGLDGDGGRWVNGGAQAMEVFREQLVEQAMARQPASAAGQSACQGFVCLLNANYNGDAPLAGYVPRGETQVLKLTGGGFSNVDGPPVVLAPASLFVDSASFKSTEEIQVTLTVGKGTALGIKNIHIFNHGQALQSAGRYLVHVVASVQELELIAAGTEPGATAAPPSANALYLGGVGAKDDYGDDTTTAADVTRAAGGLAGRLERLGDRDVFRLVVLANSTVDVASAGPADLAVELRSADETLIAADDDGGARYNFRISQVLPAGTYFIIVSHCCGGTGSYQLTTTVTPQ